jgi:glycerol-3-phosphate acyltransferase PlsY
LVTLGGYLLGSIPTAVLVSRRVAGVDIRRIGDGNMGARNVQRTLGWGPGILVAVADFGKGSAAVLLARGLVGHPPWQMIAGVAAVLGHDFPVWVGFRGGQGMATSLGALTVLMPLQTAVGLSAFGASYLMVRNFDLSAGIGLGLIVVLAWNAGLPLAWVLYAAGLFVSIGLKKWLDLPHRRRLDANRRAGGSG